MRQTSSRPIARTYRKPNYKLLYTWVADSLKQVIDDFTTLRSHFVQLIEIPLEKRKRRHRSYPRELKYSGNATPETPVSL
ncbi:MAG: hypothetical protein K2X47_13590, partial [Bdellovibrionales bacterium]|nr:hypothetical protein [Bdellovibrionales bacterium]